MDGEHVIPLLDAERPGPMLDDPWAAYAERGTRIMIRVLVSAMIIALCLWMAGGVIKLVFNLRQVFVSQWTVAAEHMILDGLVMLALLEVIRTLQAYLKLGRVRVTFIIDTALVVLIGELMGLWFKETAPEKVLLGMGVIVMLVILRIATARFSPELDHLDIRTRLFPPVTMEVGSTPEQQARQAPFTSKG